jgi:hypothetical protein
MAGAGPQRMTSALLGAGCVDCSCYSHCPDRSYLRGRGVSGCSGGRPGNGSSVAWIQGPCRSLARVGTAGLLRPRSRHISTAGVDTACSYLGQSEVARA